MKRREIEKRLRVMGGRLRRSGSNHDIWKVNGRSIPVPRHKEVRELTAMRIIRDAQEAAEEDMP